MLNISPAASIAYYIGRSKQTETLGLAQPRGTEQAQAGYYQSAMEDDPLARFGRWGGKFAHELGLKNGSAVDAKAFKNICYGYHPDTKQAFHEDIPSFKEQDEADRQMQELEHKVKMLRIDLGKAREQARVSGMDPNESDFVIEARERLEAAESEKRGLSQSGMVREKAHDLVFSVPKSLSCYLVALLAEARDENDPVKAAMAKEIEDLIFECVDKTMRHIESEWPLARPRENGTRIFQQMEGLAWAQFMHFDARPTGAEDDQGADGLSGKPEPHIHIHAVLANIAKTYRGDMQALWTKYLADNIHTLGARFRCDLAEGLRKKGHEIIPEEQDKVLSFRLAGMEKDETDAFSSRSAEVMENEGMGMGAARAKVAGRKAKLDSDEFDGDDFLTVNKQRMAAMGHDSSSIKGNWKGQYDRWLAKESRRQERAWHATNDEWNVWVARGSVGPKPKEPSKVVPPSLNSGELNVKAWNERVKKALDSRLIREKEVALLTPEIVLEHCLEMETAFTLRDIERAVNERLQFHSAPPGQTLDTVRREMVAAVLAHPDLMEVQAATGPAGLDMDGMPIFTTRSQREKEIRLYGTLLPELMDARNRLSLSPEEALKRVGEWEARKKATLADNQRATAMDILTNPAGFQIVEGFAGSGKTFMAECSFKILQEQGATLIAMAPSTSAALLLKTEIGAQEAFTPESLEAEISRRASRKDNGRGEKQEPPLIDSKTILFLDEASMLDFKETLSLVEQVVEAGGKIILSGDRKQLLSVGAGNVFKRTVSLATEKMERNGEDGPRLISFLNKDFGEHDTIQRQNLSVGRQIVAWAETGECIRALDALDRRGMIERHADGAKMLEKVAEERSAGAPAIDATAEVQRARRAMERVRAGDAPKDEADKALRRFYARMDELSKFHSERLVVAETRKQVATVNAACRRKLKEAGILGKEDFRMTLSDGRTIGVALGDRLAFTEKATTKDVVFRGDGAAVATKGTTGTVIDIRKGKDGKPQLKLLLDDRSAGGKDEHGKRRPWIWVDGDFTGLDHAYAMTVHRSQGQTAEHVQYIGSPKSSANLFLVGISRFKSTFKLHAHIGEIEGLRNAIAVEQRRIDATELGAAEYNLFDPDEVLGYVDAARELHAKTSKAYEAMDAQSAAEAAEMERRIGIARAARMEKDGMAAMVLEKVALRADDLRKPEPPRPPMPRDEALEKDIESAARKCGITIAGALSLGMARMEGVPGSLFSTPGKADMGDAKNKTPSIKESIHELAGTTTDPGTDSSASREAHTGNPGPLGSAARIPLGGPSAKGGHGRKKALAIGSGGFASRLGGLRSLRERALACYGALPGGLLQGNRGNNMDAGGQRDGLGDRDDAVRPNNPAGAKGNGGGTAQRPKWLTKLLGRLGIKDRAALDWEWLGMRGDDVVSRNLRSGQVEIWSKAALEKAGRGDLIEAAIARLGEIGPASAVDQRPAAVARGKLIEIGSSAFLDKAGNTVLPHLVIEDEDGKRKKIWGAGLGAAIRAHSVEKSEWIELRNDRKEVVSIPAPAGTEGASGNHAATVLRVGKEGVLLAGEDGGKWTIPSARAVAFGEIKAGDRVELGFIEMRRAVWDVERVLPPNAIPEKAREKAWESIAESLKNPEVERRLGLMGLQVADATRLWMKRADDIVSWDHEKDGAMVWESLGWREANGRRFLGTVLARDEDMVYLACSIGGKAGNMENAHDRIVAVPASIIGQTNDGEWVSLMATRTGITRTTPSTHELVHAAEAGDAERVMALLAAGADPDLRDKRGRTAAFMAAKAGAAEVLDVLAQSGAQVLAHAGDDTSPLVAAAKAGHPSTVGILLREGADPELSSGGWTPAVAAKASRNKECLRLIQEAVKAPHAAASAKGKGASRR